MNQVGHTLDLIVTKRIYYITCQAENEAWVGRGIEARSNALAFLDTKLHNNLTRTRSNWGAIQVHPLKDAVTSRTKEPWYKSDKQLFLVTVEIKPSFHSGLIPTVTRKQLFILYKSITREHVFYYVICWDTYIHVKPCSTASVHTCAL